jgi:hypothetical protein
VSSPSRRASWVAVIASVATLGALFFLSCEKRAIEIPRGYSGEAARNSYLAAQQSERLGTPVRNLADLSPLRASAGRRHADRADPRQALGRTRAAGLLAWVARGGHLVVVSWQLFDDAARAGPGARSDRCAPVPESDGR